GLGIVNRNRALSAGAGVTQTVGINNNTVSAIAGNVRAIGIFSRNYVAPSAAITQALTIDPNTVTAVGGTTTNLAFGIRGATIVHSSAPLSQTLAMTSNRVAGITAQYDAGGIAVRNFVYGTSAFFSQSASVKGNFVSGVNEIAFGGSAAGIEVSTS